VDARGPLLKSAEKLGDELEERRQVLEQSNAGDAAKRREHEPGGSGRAPGRPQESRHGATL
jgi:hypothetical protein